MDWCENVFESGQSWRALRGGGWLYTGLDARGAYRCGNDPAIPLVGAGFRLVHGPTSEHP
ncbi:MAG: hypothetical protein HYV63_30225 [Candidatus Schekmanbacteria bacterium]|nr:hypothetical protein [Candidatus Schekmanbacteria bacterium]